MRDAPSWTSGRSWRRCSYWTGPSCTTWTQWQRLENLKKRPRKKGIGLSCKAKILQEKQRSFFIKCLQITHYYACCTYIKYEFVLVHEFESKTVVQRARFPEKRRKKNRKVFICKLPSFKNVHFAADKGEKCFFIHFYIAIKKHLKSRVFHQYKETFSLHINAHL